MKEECKVIQPFEATEPISGAQTRFNSGEIVLCDAKQGGSTLTLEVGAVTSYFFVDRAVTYWPMAELAG